MQVKFGRSCPEGFLPVYSVNTVKEAKELLVMCCSLGYDGEYYAKELAEEQTLSNLDKFGDNLDRAYSLMRSTSS